LGCGNACSLNPPTHTPTWSKPPTADSAERTERKNPPIEVRCRIPARKVESSRTGVLQRQLLAVSIESLVGMVIHELG